MHRMTSSTFAASRDPLAAIADLERRYNGPVPEGLLRAARFGSADAAELLFAEGQAAFFKHMALAQVGIIRARRRDGSFYPALLADLGLYRRCWRRWHRQCRALRAALASARAAPP
jgi:hypothetical protein